MKYINKINKANKGSKENRSALYLQLGVPLLWLISQSLIIFTSPNIFILYHIGSDYTVWTRFKINSKIKWIRKFHTEPLVNRLNGKTWNTVLTHYSDIFVRPKKGVTILRNVTILASGGFRILVLELEFLLKNEFFLAQCFNPHAPDRFTPSRARCA